MLGRLTLSALAVVAVLLASSAARAAELRLLSSNAMTSLMGDLLPEFERSTGHKVTATFEPTNAVMGRIKAGENADVVIVIRQGADQLASAANLVAASETDVARTSLGFAVRAGAPKPDIATVESLKAALLAAKSIALSEIGASGIQFRRILERLGIADRVTSKLTILPGAVRTAQWAARGEVDLAVQFVSELTGVPGAEILGPLPPEFRYEIVLTASLDAHAKEPAAGMALIQFLTRPANLPVLARNGMERP